MLLKLPGVRKVKRKVKKIMRGMRSNEVREKITDVDRKKENELMPKKERE